MYFFKILFFILIQNLNEHKCSTLINISLTSPISYHKCLYIKNHYFKQIVKLFIITYTKSNNLQIRIENFWSFDQIKFECFDSSEISYNIYFVPKRQLVLDSSLKFNFNEPHKKKHEILSELIYIYFYNLKGYGHIDQSFSNILNYYDQIKVYMFYSNLKIYINDTKLENCSVIEKLNLNYFKNISYLFFTFSTKYNLNTCPQVFKDVKLNQLIFHGISESFLKKNMLGFKEFNETISNEIEQMKINCFRSKITKSLLNPNMLKSLNYIYIAGSINFIDDDVLNNLTNLRLISLNMDNFRQFSSKGFKWFSNFQPNVHLNLIIDYDEHFVFDDQDICFFKDFVANHKNLIYITDLIQNCSCTLVWIYQNFLDNMTFVNHIFENDKNLFSNINRYTRQCDLISKYSFRECNFDFKFNQCEQMKSIRKIFKTKDLIYLSEFFNLTNIILNSLFSIIGIVTNILSILVSIFLLKTKNLKVSRFLNQIFLLYSSVNFSIFLINILNLMNKCVYVNGIFCSKIIRNYYVQLFEIVFGQFLTNILKFVSNICITCISINRLENLISQKKLLQNINFKKLVFILFLFGIFLSFDKLVSISINFDYFVLEEKDYREFPNSNTFQFLFQRNAVNSIKFKFNGTIALIFYIFFMINFLINDILLVLITIFIDIALLYVLNKNIKKKTLLLANIAGSEVEKNIRSSEKRQTKITILVIVNLLIIILAKLFHLSVSIYYVAEKFHFKKQKNVCATNSRICSNFQQFSEMIYNFSNMYSFYLFLNLNKNFNKMFFNLFQIRFSSKNQQVIRKV